MSSILTNTGAMTALQTLKGINASLAKTQDEISTGKSVSTAKDNAAIWAISKVMEADVSGFKAISSSLALGSATVSNARVGAETISDLLTQMRDRIVSAQEQNVDRVKLQADVDKLRSQIETVVKGSQFNGLNLLDGSAGASISILSSLDRSAGNVTASYINVDTQDLSIGGYVAQAALTGSTGVSGSADAASFVVNAGDTTGGNLVIDAAATFAEGDSISVNIGGKTASYTVTANDIAATTTSDIVAIGLKNAIEGLGITGLAVDYDSGTPGQLVIKSDATTPTTSDLTVTAQYKNAGSGGLGLLAGLDVSTSAGAESALANIESMLQTAINSAAEFGSAGKRIEIQSNFLSKLTDSLKSGIGAMVDADMEEASARLQALQTQQQLGIQSLSIANQAPRNVLSLFRS